MAHQERLNIAVFVDFDNIEIGVKSTLNEHFDVGPILEAIKERGEIVSKIAYADWTRAGDYSRHLTQHAIRLVQRNLTPGGDKNGADINMALDALEMAFTHPHINAYVIVGGDSDFLSLVEKLKQYDKKVFVVGGRAFTSVILQRNCHEFVAYENLVRTKARPAGGSGGGRGEQKPSASAIGQAYPVSQAYPIVRRALKILADREVSPQTGLLKSTLLQLDSTFSERNYGASSFLDFTEKLAQAGFVSLKHSGRSVMVELNEAFDDKSAAAAEGAAPGGEEEGAPAPAPAAAAAPAPAGHRAPQQPEVPQLGDQAEGVRRAGQIIAAAKQARWPMYLRNVKQILRASEGGFDERRYGFQGLIDLLRACQKEGFVRMERDRRGGLRVFQGNLQRAAPAPAIFDIEDELNALGQAEGGPSEGQPGEPPSPRPVQDEMDIEPIEPEVVPIDTTAELLGTKPRKPRAARPAAGATRTTRATGGGTRKAAAKKPAGTKKTARPRKAAAAETKDESGE